MAPAREVAMEASAVYEEIDKWEEHSETKEQSRPPNGEYELTQCAAYGPVTTL